MTVPIDGFSAEKKLQVAREVPDDEQEHHETRHRHDVFFAQRRTKDARNDFHSDRLASVGNATARTLMSGVPNRQWFMSGY